MKYSMSLPLASAFSPGWSGARQIRQPIRIPDCVYDSFEMVSHEEYDILVPFTRETWHGRMKACRGVGASLTKEELANWEAEHMKLMEQLAPEEFEVLHHAALAELKVKEI